MSKRIAALGWLKRRWLRVANLDVINWVVLQWVAVITYAILSLWLIAEAVTGPDWNPGPLLVTSLFSLLVMTARLTWTHDAGFWGKSKKNGSRYAQAVKKKHLQLWSPAFLPERAAAVSLILMAYMSFFSSDLGGGASTIVGLFTTGALLAAVVTSPHALFDLQKDLDDEQGKHDRAGNASRGDHGDADQPDG